MSAFCVYGMTSLIAKVRAEKRHMPKDFEGTREEFMLMQQEEILKKSTVCQVSPAFDAPQFCNDWIALAKKQMKVSRLKIMCRGQKKDAKGGYVSTSAQNSRLLTGCLMNISEWTMKPWTKAEIEYIKEHCRTKGRAEIARALGRTKPAIQNRVARLGLVAQPGAKKMPDWCPKEIQHIKDNYQKLTADEIGQAIGRSKRAVQTKVLHLGLRKRETWTDPEIDFLKSNFNRLSYVKLSKKLNKSVESCRLRSRSIGLGKKERVMDKVMFKPSCTSPQTPKTEIKQQTWIPL